ncbi:hypothetical protein P0E64_08820 [Enterococcus faecalis]|uniref:hypothetical protein n=1 Tax=Enterococcus TaxID=1350 RepID=UPI0019FC6A9D|nr:hypothetical protein [Enterococcus faecalis]EGO7933218.1 hypothetical protein [Enterococcus faecalis]MDN3125212.1 hypothetical protein [Enterococcus faecalis]MDT2225173.1 hypothetical protein [Enterococcus faecalis]HBI1613451.1 hypothetical protein [Enterococcus faecalis]
MKIEELKEKIEQERQLEIRRECEELEVRKECLFACVNYRIRGLCFYLLLLKKSCKYRRIIYYRGISLLFFGYLNYSFLSFVRTINISSVLDVFDVDNMGWFVLLIIFGFLFVGIIVTIFEKFYELKPALGFSLKGIYDEVQRIDKEIEKNKAKLNK